MNKVKKVVTSLGVFFTGIISKVFAANLDATIVPGPMAKYGVYEPTLGEKISSAGKIVIPILIFLIGLGVILSKKNYKKSESGHTIWISYIGGSSLFCDELYSK